MAAKVKIRWQADPQLSGLQAAYIARREPHALTTKPKSHCFSRSPKSIAGWFPRHWTLESFGSSCLPNTCLIPVKARLARLR